MSATLPCALCDSDVPADATVCPWCKGDPGAEMVPCPSRYCEDGYEEVQVVCRATAAAFLHDSPTYERRPCATCGGGGEVEAPYAHLRAAAAKEAA